MRKRTIGTGALEVSALGLGRLGMSQSHRPARDKPELSVLVHATPECREVARPVALLAHQAPVDDLSLDRRRGES